MESLSPEELTTCSSESSTGGENRLAARERRLAEEFDIVGALSLETRDLPVVLDADDELAACRVGEGADVPRDLVRILTGALPFEVLPLLRFGEAAGVVDADRLLHAIHPVSFSQVRQRIGDG